VELGGEEYASVFGAFGMIWRKKLQTGAGARGSHRENPFWGGIGARPSDKKGGTRSNLRKTFQIRRRVKNANGK